MAPAPVEMASGNTPKMKAMEVIRMGRKRSRQASSVASSRPRPRRRMVLANSMIRIAFLADKPITAMSPTLKYTSSSRPRSQVKVSAPSTPSGTTSMTATGIDQLS